MAKEKKILVPNEKFIKKLEESELGKIELANKAGVTRETVYNIIKGTDPKVSSAIKLADVLECDVKDIFE